MITQPSLHRHAELVSASIVQPTKAVRNFVFLISAIGVATGCKSHSSVELMAAKAFQAMAEKCLMSVRDDKMQFEQAPNCRLAEQKLDSFVQARDLHERTPIEVQVLSESGYRMAWAARAKSAANNPSLKLW